MPDDRHDVRIGHQLLGGRDGLGGIALIIQRNQRHPVAGDQLASGLHLLDGQAGAAQHILAVRRLVAGQRGDEPHFDDWDFGLPTASNK